MDSTGIAVFAYNRPEHLAKVVNGLKRNEIEHIYFFSDGPKNSREEEDVIAVRNVIDDIDWCEKTVLCQEKNIGLANSIIRGVERVFEDHDQIIVLEDDCVPSNDFVDFMTSCLRKYKDESRVMNINGYSPPINIPNEYSCDVYFTYRNSSWGWGTWKSAWDDFEYEPMTKSEFDCNSREIKQQTRPAGRDLYSLMRAQIEGRIDSWAVWWSYAIVSSNAVCVNPVNSKIENIGHDGSGTHTRSSTRFEVDVDYRGGGQVNFPEGIEVNHKINSRYNKHISGGSRNYIKRLLKEYICYR